MIHSVDMHCLFMHQQQRKLIIGIILNLSYTETKRHFEIFLMKKSSERIIKNVFKIRYCFLIYVYLNHTVISIICISLCIQIMFVNFQGTLDRGFVLRNL